MSCPDIIYLHFTGRKWGYPTYMLAGDYACGRMDGQTVEPIGKMNGQTDEPTDGWAKLKKSPTVLT